MRIVRIVTTVAVMASGAIVLWPSTANSANPVGDGFCHGGGPTSGDMCIGKTDGGAPWADWTGDNEIDVFNDWRYSGFPNDSPNDDGEFAINHDHDAQYVFEDPNQTGPVSCFPHPYLDSDMKGREDNDSSLRPRFGISGC